MCPHICQTVFWTCTHAPEWDDDDDDYLTNNYCTEVFKLEFKMRDITAYKCTHLGIVNWRFDEQTVVFEYTVDFIIEWWASFSIMVKEGVADDNIMLWLVVAFPPPLANV